MEDVLKILRNMAVNRGVKLTDAELWEELRLWLSSNAKLIFFRKRKPEPTSTAKPNSTFRCGVCNDTGNLQIRWENGDPVYGQCSCQRKRIQA